MLLRRSRARTRAKQLVERERLHEIVVGAGVETGDAVGDLVAGGQHQHRRVIAPVAQDPADRQPVGPGHEHVEHDGVGRELVDPQQRVVAVDRGVHVVALEPQRALDRLADVRVVLDDEHAALLPGWRT